MKQLFFLSIVLLESFFGFSQSVVINQTPCSEKDVQYLPALYYNHTKPKYGVVLSGPNTATDKAKIIATLNNIEKLEENSRKYFQATGTVMRVSYSSKVNNISGRNYFSGYAYTGYGYQLGLYHMVCHVQQHVVKEVSEYQNVLRIDANPTLTQGSFYGEKGDFYVTDKSVRYDIPTDAKWNGFYDKQYDIDRYTKRSKIDQYISAEMILNGKSAVPKYNSDFEKFINGNGPIDDYWDYDKGKYPKEKSKINQYWAITKPGIPLLVPVTRKEFLEALLEYYEIEKYNFAWLAEYKKKNEPSKSPIINADNSAYNQIYETKKARITNLLKTKSADWLSKQVAAPKGNRGNDYAKASNGLFDFYDFENGIPLYKYNPEYFKTTSNDPLKPLFFLIEFRFGGGESNLWSVNLENNFEKNFDFEALRKMLE